MLRKKCYIYLSLKIILQEIVLGHTSHADKCSLVNFVDCKHFGNFLISNTIPTFLIHA